MRYVSTEAKSVKESVASSMNVYYIYLFGYNRQAMLNILDELKPGNIGGVTFWSLEKEEKLPPVVDNLLGIIYPAR